MFENLRRSLKEKWKELLPDITAKDIMKPFKDSS
jgi:hypothetical protein